jgi:hypothetical protein
MPRDSGQAFDLRPAGLLAMGHSRDRTTPSRRVDLLQMSDYQAAVAVDDVDA